MRISIFLKLFLFFSLFSIIDYQVFAQAPESMNYQAVIRDGSGNIVASQSVGIRIKILEGSTSGSSVYEETFAPTSNAYGSIAIQIGTGTVVSGTFSAINWGANSYFVETAVDISGGNTYTVISTTQFVSVPYALYAKNARLDSAAIQGMIDASEGATNSGLSYISTDTISPLMKFIGTGFNGALDCDNFTGELEGEYFFTNFTVDVNCVLSLKPSKTTIIHVKDTCKISGVINGNGVLVSPYQETRTWIGAAGGCSQVSGWSCQSCSYGTFEWSFSPTGLTELLGYSHSKSRSKWQNANMSLEDVRISSWLGTNINGYAGNYVNCGQGVSPYTSQGGAGLIIISKNLIFDGNINLRGGPSANGTGAGGGGSLIISCENLISNTGSVDLSSGAGDGFFYLIDY